jgi:hypothetical protein
MSAGSAWYSNDRDSFLSEKVQSVVGQLASNAVAEGLHVEAEQHTEWRSSIGVLQKELQHRAREVELLKSTLSAPELAEYRQVILEFDFRRRGLRMDCVLLGDGIVAVIEFKRSTLAAVDREQVASYCVNLVEFHEETRRLTTEEHAIVAPLLALTSAGAPKPKAGPLAFHRAPWDFVLRDVLTCDSASLHRALLSALRARRANTPIDGARWLDSKFSPSSTILDAAISLYGQHDVSAIANHAAPVELLEKCTEEIAQRILCSRRDATNRILFVSGAPGAGKTLVGLKLAFDPRFREDAVFVTGNAPLVEVLSAALKGAYRARAGASLAVPSGYSRADAHRLIEMSTFKIVKAHAFLGQRGAGTGSVDGRIVIFDEAQRTYQAGREVLRKRLEADEAKLILDSLEDSYGKGVVVVALVGHNQAINRGELGIAAWFKAAEQCGWSYAIADETLALSELAGAEAGSSPTAEAHVWANHPRRERLEVGHLPHSLRYYRNSDVERWAEWVLADEPEEAARLATTLDARGDTVWITRELARAREWVRERRVGEERAGIIASGQARRLAAEGLFVDLKPDIAKWMLAPAGDIRSANMLETVQNQYQIQGLEIDFAVVCWDGDLRREGGRWRSYKLSGADWKRDKALEIAKNGYRVLLTRARKGMVLFVPRGDATGDDATRRTEMYDAIAEYLIECGARAVDEHRVASSSATAT